METFKKIMSGFGLILAIPLILILTLLLTLSPTISTATSILTPEKLTDIVSSTASAVVTDADAAQMLFPTDRSETPSDDAPQHNEAVEGNTVDSAEISSALEDMGLNLSPELMDKLLNSKMADELLSAYIGDFSNSLAGANEEPQFNSENIKEIVNNNFDEVIEIVQQEIPEAAEVPAETIKAELSAKIDENLDFIFENVPSPETISQQIVGEIPEFEIVFQILANRPVIIGGLVAILLALCLLIILFRLPFYRSARWIGVDLICGSILNGIFAIAVLLVPVLLPQIFSELVPDLPVSVIQNAISPLFSSLGVGLIIRDLIMLAIGIALTVLGVNLKRRKKAKMLGTENPPVSGKPQKIPSAPPMKSTTNQEAPVGEQDSPADEQEEINDETQEVLN